MSSIIFLQIAVLFLCSPFILCTEYKSQEDLAQQHPASIESMIHSLVLDTDEEISEIDLQPFYSYRNFLKNQRFKK